MLLWSREEQVAVTGDIEAIFHQVKISEDHRKFLRFLWWKDSDPTQEIIDHEMPAHVFEGISSSSCSNYALRKTSAEDVRKYGEDVTSILKRNFYADDMLKSFSAVKLAAPQTQIPSTN